MPTFNELSKQPDKTHVGIVTGKDDTGYLIDIGGIGRTIKSSSGDLEPGSQVVVTETSQGWLVISSGFKSGRKIVEVDIEG